MCIHVIFFLEHGVTQWAPSNVPNSRMGDLSDFSDETISHIHICILKPNLYYYTANGQSFQNLK